MNARESAGGSGDPPTTLYEKIFRSHIVREDEDSSLIYVDRHLVHEVTSPQAFEGLRLAGRVVRRPERTVATMDHNVSTRSRDISAAGDISRRQLEALRQNCQDFAIPLYDIAHPDQGIVHIIGPELGLTLPGMTVVCGDSHTATHGALGALAFGIGTTEVEHVLATQTIERRRSRTMLIQCEGHLSPGVEPKDLILHIIGLIGTGGAQGHVIEYAGETIRSMSMEGRMTVCNMSIEAGAVAGMIAPDETTFAYMRGRDFAPTGGDLPKAIDAWSALRSDAGAVFDQVVHIDASAVRPQITWGTNPGQVICIDDTIPDPATQADSDSTQRALDYMGLTPGIRICDVPVDQVFIGSCTNGRIEDLRMAAGIILRHPPGRRVREGVTAIVVPGSQRVRAQAEAEGLDRIFQEAGFEWRLPGCSICLAMNDDVVKPGQRCASTSNRNFEGRQGRGSRTHLVGAAMAAAAAIAGHFVDVRKFV